MHARDGHMTKKGQVRIKGKISKRRGPNNETTDIVRKKARYFSQSCSILPVFLVFLLVALFLSRALSPFHRLLIHFHNFNVRGSYCSRFH